MCADSTQYHDVALIDFELDASTNVHVPMSHGFEVSFVQ